MKHKKDCEPKTKFMPFTDLAMEAAQMLINESKTENSTIKGVKITTENFQNETITVTHVEVLDETGEKNIGKPVGNYITVESQNIKVNDSIAHEEVIKVLASKFSKFDKLKDVNKEAPVLIVGLGNWNVTPDALGPKVIAKILVTNHLKNDMPPELLGKVRSVSAISPGVMGLTGIETGQIIKGIVETTSPKLVIDIDALAGRETSRINATIQMSDTGINPGAGVGNKRMALNEETLGVPVIAIGVPTVVDAATLVNDSLDMMLNSMISQVDEGSEFYEMLENLESEEKYSLIKSVLDPYASGMFVTPKEVDSVIEHLSNIIANALNISLHDGIDIEDINRYIY